MFSASQLEVASRSFHERNVTFHFDVNYAHSAQYFGEMTVTFEFVCLVYIFNIFATSLDNHIYCRKLSGRKSDETNRSSSAFDIYCLLWASIGVVG